ncbi:hypothetical protein QR680_015990 [Steinernema hermaphroditum]|uniref:Cation-transporting P-type ATPase N-terminal domain-containing protein n=1 Tax=Steinernema hermaphroditum TaxID=289476 RepID=A0AA39H9Y2_9BILA|nr:hypothetical protein QR680_015990 [Steinernema hermaphroditum]
MGFIGRFVRCCRKNRKNHIKRVEESSRSLSSSFVEHNMDATQLSRVYPNSMINIDNPKLSKGLSKEQAEKRLQQDGPNVLAPPKEISNLLLFLRQFLNLFWVLMIGAGALSLITYFIDMTVRLNLYVAIVLFLLVLGMCIGTFIQEKKAINVVKGFTNLLPPKCTVVRDGKATTIDSEKIVVGDIVLVKNGSRVPADLRLLHCSDLKLETSSITGESEPIEIRSEPADVGVDVFDSNCVAFNGSFCVDGEGIGITIRTGQKTIIGQIASLTIEQEEEPSSLQREIGRFVTFVTVSALIMAVVVFVLGCIMTHFEDVTGMFINGFLVVVVANVPQGLPATVSSELTIIARRMAKKNVYMKKLDVIEAFGATTVVASDKTGTLTMNNMTVTDLWYNRKYINGLPDISHKTMNTLTQNQGDQATVKSRLMAADLDIFESPLPQLLAGMAVCNKAQIEYHGNTVANDQLTVNTRLKRIEEVLWRPSGKVGPSEYGDLESTQVTFQAGTKKPSLGGRKMSIFGKEKQFVGSPSEVALLRYVDKIFSVPHIRQRYHVVYEVPFNSLRKWHLMILQESGAQCDEDGNAEFLLMLKGAPEVVIQKCGTLATDTGADILDEEAIMDFQDAYDHFGSNGRRVIGFSQTTFVAHKDTKFNWESGNVPMDDLTFLGIAAIMDPPRPTTAKAIQICKDAGIKVFMVTGDHPTTATAIAREIGLIGASEKVTPRRLGKTVSVNVVEEDEDEERDWATVHGKMLPDMTDEDWDDLLQHKYIVFARTTPEQKLLIVEQCQKRKEVVTVTGDGVNDAPALKKANIGVAMGITGSDVAKQAADVILMDDNFASIVNGIEEGRLLFDNLRKTIGYTLTHSMPEVVPICLNFLFGLPMAITALQILSIDLGTELTPAISLAYENAESDIMSKPPRKRTNRLVSFTLLFYSYIIAGGMVITGCTMAYFFTYWWNGIPPLKMFFSATQYFKYHPDGNLTINGEIFDEARQLDIRNQGAAAYYMTMVVSQAFHVWMCKTRRTSIFAHGFFSNAVTIYGVIIELCLVSIFVYVPGINFIMGGAPPPYPVWFFPVGVGVALWIYNETRKYIIRKDPHNPCIHAFKW